MLSFPAFKNQSRPCLNTICKPIKHVEIGQKHQVTENIRTRRIKKNSCNSTSPHPFSSSLFSASSPVARDHLKQGRRECIGLGEKRQSQQQAGQRILAQTTSLNHLTTPLCQVIGQTLKYRSSFDSQYSSVQV